ncbi:YdhK family protein [Mesobacillus zeae]|uniref:DUF1541 domain-containing protein n=1 Tax=Mesobacillus zeae TaxID=1917180 RepID=A0A398BIZ9_9BACI|nr:YdhK family protein [Mesobacillus zeae]RID87750.1 DUF1541 domain-containing protein [Mesobacillus zeae]
MKIRKSWLLLLTLALAFTLTACSGSADKSSENDTEEPAAKSTEEAMNHSEMNHSGSSEVPKGLVEAKHPKYKVGEQAIITTGHMEGMKGAKATISGAYETTAYVVSYNPTTGGKRVENHKWVIHEELKDHESKAVEPGTKVTIMTDHMEGMHGAEGVIEIAEQTTVYMVDFTPTNGEKKVTNHKWVTESELSPVNQ